MTDTARLINQFYAQLAGADAPEEFLRDAVSITVENSLHLPDAATIVLNDPRLAWIDDPRVAPGKPLTIAARGASGEKPLFDGEIVELEPEFGAGLHRLTIRAFDRLHRLGRGRHVRTFQNVSDDDLVRQIAQEVGLQSRVQATSVVHEYAIQHAESNLEFLRRRTESLGYLLYVEGKTLCCEPPSESGTPITVEWGTTLSAFRPRLTTVVQVAGVRVRGWDPQQRREIVGQAERERGAPKIGESRTGGEVATAAFGEAAWDLVADRPIRSQAEADQLARAVAARAAGRFIEAEGTCSGNPAIRAGSFLQIGAVGDRFSGRYFVTGTTHHYDERGGYNTHFAVSGHEPATLLSILRPMGAAPSAGFNLLIGIVTDNNDPQGQGRVKVKFPTLSGDHASNWARVVAPGAGKDRGIAFLPEVNDEVLVGCELGDPDYPYVLGGLWNGVDSPPKESVVEPNGSVKARAIVSRTGHTIVIDDETGGGGITIEDSAGNKIALDTRTNALTIKVSGDATISADANLTLEARGQIQLRGLGITIDGGAATVDVKGTVINLN